MNRAYKKTAIFIGAICLFLCVEFVLLKAVCKKEIPIYHDDGPYYRGVVQTSSGYTIYDDSGTKISDTFKYIDLSDMKAHQSRYVRFVDENMSGLLDVLTGSIKYSTRMYALQDPIQSNLDLIKPIKNKVSQKMGLINLSNGYVIIEADYDCLIMTDLGDIVGLQSDNLYLIDSDSKKKTIIRKNIDEVMQLFGGKVLAAKLIEGGVYQLIDTGGSPVCDMKFSKFEIDADNKVTSYIEGEPQKPVTITLSFENNNVYMNIVSNCFLIEENECGNLSKKKMSQQ